MATVSVSVPDELKKEMDEMKIMNWSGVARKAFEERLALLKRLDEITSKSVATDEDIERISKKIKHAMAKHYEAELRKDRR